MRNSSAGMDVNLSSPVHFPLYGRVTAPPFDLLPLEDSKARRLFETSQRSHEIESSQFFLPSVYGDGNCLFQAASIAINGSSDEHWRTPQVGRSLKMNCNSRLVTSLRYWQGVLSESANSVLLQTMSQSSQDIFISQSGLLASTQREIQLALISAFESDGNECVKSGGFSSLHHICALATVQIRSLSKLQFGCSSIL